MVQVALDSLSLVWFLFGISIGVNIVTIVYISNGMPKGPR